MYVVLKKYIVVQLSFDPGQPSTIKSDSFYIIPHLVLNTKRRPSCLPRMSLPQVAFSVHDIATVYSDALYGVYNVGEVPLIDENLIVCLCL